MKKIFVLCCAILSILLLAACGNSSSSNNSNNSNKPAGNESKELSDEEIETIAMTKVVEKIGERYFIEDAKKQGANLGMINSELSLDKSTYEIAEISKSDSYITVEGRVRCKDKYGDLIDCRNVIVVDCIDLYFVVKMMPDGSSCFCEHLSWMKP